jgi:hypothetical protein
MTACHVNMDGHRNVNGHCLYCSEPMTGPTPLSPERLAEIREREQAATKGPWGTYFDHVVYDVVADLQPNGSGYSCRRQIAELRDEPIDNDPAHRDWTAEEDATQIFHDATFITRSREDVPALLAEVERQAKRVAELEPLEHMAPQQCPKGVHADWLVDSENTHQCPWCRIAELEAGRPIFVDGRGVWWMSTGAKDTDGFDLLSQAGHPEIVESTESILQRTGSLREIGRCL